MTPEMWTADECAVLGVQPADMARAYQAVVEWHRGGNLVARIAVALREEREAAHAWHASSAGERAGDPPRRCLRCRAGLPAGRLVYCSHCLEGP